MREPQFSRLPLIWKKLDKQAILERFLAVEDTELNLVRQQIEDLLLSRDVNTIPDKFLRIIGYAVGHRWKDYRSYTWNRQRIGELIYKYSYKGSDACLSDLVYEHGGDWYKVVDMASLVGVYDRQGTMIQASHYFDADFFHPGVYQLWLPDYIDLPHFLEDFEYIKPAGTKWIIRYCIADCHAAVEFVGHGIPIAIYNTEFDYSYKLFDANFGFYNHIPQPSYTPVVLETLWIALTAQDPQLYNQAFYVTLPQFPVVPTTYPVLWLPLELGSYPMFGDSFYDFYPQRAVYPSLIYVDDILAFANARLDMGSLTFNWGEEELNFEDDFVPEELNWMQPLVEPIILT